MATVGAVSCTYVKRPSVRKLRTRGEHWQIPGINGYGAQTFGTGDAEFSFTVVKFAAVADVETWFRNIEDLAWTIVTVTDDWDISYPYLLITEVGPPRLTAARGKHESQNYDARGELTVKGVKTQ